jgi:signal transduction histidine kinase
VIRRWLWPRSLTGQMALLVALALFVAQAVNFSLLLQERRQVRFEQITAPSIARMIDAVERAEAGRPPAERGGVAPVATSPMTADVVPNADVSSALQHQLNDAGFADTQVVAGVKPLRTDDPWLLDMGPHRRRRMMRFNHQIVMGVNVAGQGWLMIQAPWPQSDDKILWGLIGQTLIFYIIVLIPVLWAGRRIARPLRLLATSAQRFRPGDNESPLDETGPYDVRAVIVAYNALRLRVLAMLDEKDRMLGAIGHDLRTPLAALRVRIESVEDENDRARMADTIEEMNRTLDDILSLARLGRPSAPLVDVDLAALVDAVVEDFRDLGAPVSFEEAARLTMKLRPSLMRRALRNLIENAIKYGHGAAVRLIPGGDTVEIVVEDEGPGIPPDRLNDVFEAFTRLEGSRNKDTGGIGLGLALARTIVRDAGGDIRLVNRPEGGLSATIVLPRLR